MVSSGLFVLDRSQDRRKPQSNDINSTFQVSELKETKTKTNPILNIMIGAMNEGTHKVLNRLERMAEREFLPSIGPVKGKIIADVIQNYRPRRILEIGTLYGYSAILMGSMLPEGQNEGKVTTIEIDKESANIARKNIEDAALADKVEVIEGDALDIIPKLNEKFDMIFLDGPKEEYFKYLILAEKNLDKGAVVVADNVGIFKTSMRDYLEHVRSSGRYNSRVLETELEFNSNTKDAIEVSIKIV
jgi:predicted O-methyltransferase YrrM